MDVIYLRVQLHHLAPQLPALFPEALLHLLFHLPLHHSKPTFRVQTM